MTANQIAYVRVLEDERTHRAQETETARANRAREQEDYRAHTLNYNASIYASDVAKYGHQLNYESSIYSTQVNAAVRQREQDMNYNLGVYKTQMDYAMNAENLRYKEAQMINDYHLEAYKATNQAAHYLAQDKVSAVNAAVNLMSGGIFNTAQNVISWGTNLLRK